MRSVRMTMTVLAFTALAVGGLSGLNAQASTHQAVTTTMQSSETQCGQAAIGAKCTKWRDKCQWDKQHHKHCKRVCVKKG